MNLSGAGTSAGGGGGNGGGGAELVSVVGIVDGLALEVFLLRVSLLTYCIVESAGADEAAAGSDAPLSAVADVAGAGT